jgi:hypothetical protein
MAKQTFTTGQVLTADQMTSLQQTAMGGGAATAKTASYVLVAADAGTTVAMNAAGATTITVNTGLFAAGDTVFIQNLGAGACTVTAGTATVATAGSLILPQNDAGILYFTSASAAIFYDYIQVGATSPLTTKGDLYTFGTSDTRLGVGANGTTLVADSSESLGIKWATPAGAITSFSLLNAGGTALSGANIRTVSGISGQQKLLIFVTGGTTASTSVNFGFRLNTDSSSLYDTSGITFFPTSSYAASSFISYNLFEFDEIRIGNSSSNASSVMSGSLLIDGANGTGFKTYTGSGGATAAGGDSQNMRTFQGVYKGTSTISSVSIFTAGANFTAGTIYVYGSAN